MEYIPSLNSLWYKAKLKLTEIFARFFSFIHVNRNQRKEKRVKYRRYLRQLFRVNCKRVAYGQKFIYSGQISADIVAAKILQDAPCFIARFGLVEMRAVSFYINAHKARLRFLPELASRMSVNAGFFPATDANLARYASEVIDIAPQIDVLCCWNRDEEEQFVRLFCPTVKLLDFQATFPLSFANPWTRALRGKKVLVISPFAKLIEKQYAMREYLFENANVLPEFELITIEAVQSIADNKKHIPFEDWFEALDSMTEQINLVDFDIALIGAGAYGMHLGIHCKGLGKQAMLMGGMLQVLFGIYGARWEKTLEEQGILNEYWVKPDQKYRPEGFEKVEDGCYW